MWTCFGIRLSSGRWSGPRVATCRGASLAAEANAIAVTSGRTRFGAPSARAGAARVTRATVIAASALRDAVRRRAKSMQSNARAARAAHRVRTEIAPAAPEGTLQPRRIVQRHALAPSDDGAGDVRGAMTQCATMAELTRRVSPALDTTMATARLDAQAGSSGISVKPSPPASTRPRTQPA